MEFILVLSSLAVPLLIGEVLLDTLTHGKNYFYFWEQIFIALGLGWGSITLSMFYMSWIRIHFTLFVVTAFVSFLAIVIFILSKRTNQLESQSKSLVSTIKRPVNGWGFREILLVLIMIFAAAFLFFTTMIIVNDIWDSWAVWGFKAKIYFVHQSIPFEIGRAHV